MGFASNSITILLTKVIGTLFNFVQGILNVTLLHQAFVNLNQEGNSNKSVKTISFNSRFDSSPSPLNVLKLILSADKFLVNLQQQVNYRKMHTKITFGTLPGEMF